MCHWGKALGFQKPKPDLVALFLLLAGPDVELSAPSPAPRLPAGHHAAFQADSVITSGTVSKPQFNALLYKSCCGHGVSSWQ